MTSKPKTSQTVTDEDFLEFFFGNNPTPRLPESSETLSRNLPSSTESPPAKSPVTKPNQNELEFLFSKYNPNSESHSISINNESVDKSSELIAEIHSLVSTFKDDTIKPASQTLTDSIEQNFFNKDSINELLTTQSNTIKTLFNTRKDIENFLSEYGPKTTETSQHLAFYAAKRINSLRTDLYSIYSRLRRLKKLLNLPVDNNTSEESNDDNNNIDNNNDNDNTANIEKNNDKDNIDNNNDIDNTTNEQFNVISNDH